MLTDKQLNSVRKFFQDKTFTYKGEMLPDLPTKSEFDFKIKIGDYRKMMSVGEYYDYLQVEVFITKLKDNLSRLVLSNTFGDYTDLFKKQLYFLYSNLSSYISEKLIYFDPNIRVIISNIQVLDENTEIVKEDNTKKMSNIAIRTVVKDILTTIKNKKTGQYNLPSDDGDEYSFSNLPFTFSVELHLFSDKDITDFVVDGNWFGDEEVMEIIVTYNPTNLRKNLYDIVGELNEVIAHELTHGKQNLNTGVVTEEKNLTPIEYYTQPKELEAQKNGFKRLSKLRKVPYNVVVENWFNTHKEIHGLTESQTKEVINLLL